MYNTLFGRNNLTAVCFEAAQITSRIERFRDAIFKRDDNYGAVVEILTRTGGPNRKDYPNTGLISNPNYLRSYEDEYDNTYAHFIFKIDNKYMGRLDLNRILVSQSRKSLNLKEMFEQHFAEMEVEGTRANALAKQMAEGLSKIINRPEEKTYGNNIVFITMDDIIAAGKKDKN